VAEWCEGDYEKAMTSEEIYNELAYYTLAHRDPSFIHQHLVDAFAAQTADENMKPIKITFALIGLYLHVEKQFTGKQVQQVHMALGRRKHPWPSFALPADHGKITAADVLGAGDRDNAIHAWCRSVWDAYRDCRHAVIELLRQHGIE
jgi:hypothetical protein